MKAKRLGRRAGAVAGFAMAALLAGCDGFFVPLTTTTGGTGGNTTDNLYVANVAARTISAYGVGTGVFKEVPGSPYALNFIPTAVAITPDNQFLYVGGDGLLVLYKIEATGALTAQNGGASLNAASIASMDISPDGQFLYVLDGFVKQTATASGFNYVGGVDVFGITKSTGGLSQSVLTTFTVTGTTIVPKAIKVTPAGTNLYAAVGTAGVLGFNVNASTGVLSNGLIYTPSTISSDNGVAIDGNSQLLYVPQSGVTSGLLGFSIGSSGGLTALPGIPYPTGQGPVSAVIDSSNKYVYVANSLEKSTANLTGFSIGSTGGLTALASSPFGSGSSVISLGQDNSGKYIVAASSGGGPDLALYSSSTSSPGGLTSVSTVSPATSAGPGAIALTH